MFLCYLDKILYDESVLDDILLTRLEGLRIFIATLKMHNQTGWVDWAEIFRIVQVLNCWAVQKIVLRYNPSDPFYRSIKAKNGNQNTYAYNDCIDDI